MQTARTEVVQSRSLQEQADHGLRRPPAEGELGWRRLLSLRPQI